MSWQPTRDLVGYGPNPPDPKWPGGARVAVNFVMNYEEGSEPSMQDGEGYTETGLTESSTSSIGLKGRDLAGESMFEFGSRVGFWRIMRAFQERGLPLTVFGCALALERNPLAADAIRKSGFDVCCHGWRWVRHFQLSEAEEREHIQKAVKSLEQTVGDRPAGWYCRYGPSVNTRRLLVEGRRLHLRFGLLWRGAALLADRRGQAAPGRALLAHQQRRQICRRHDSFRPVVRPGARRFRRALS
jgi:peptidoglycan/xylan/chitin deacetylase (PgdA/CDA1 family)